MSDATTIRVGADTIAAALTAAWNAGDSAAFAREFTSDADFVNIFAMHFTGRDAIAKAHQFIFDGFYRGSRNAFSVVKTRAFGSDAIVAHIAADLQIPQGPMAGSLRSLATAVLVRGASGWSIVSFHNTREQAPPEILPA